MNLPELPKYIPEAALDAIFREGIESIEIVDHLPPSKKDTLTLGCLQRHCKKIELSKNFYLTLTAKKLTREVGMEISPEEVYEWLAYHELAHFLYYPSEEACDLFACKRLARRRGWEKRYTIHVNLDLEVMRRGIKEAIKEALSERSVTK